MASRGTITPPRRAGEGWLAGERRFGVPRRTDTPDQRMPIVVAAQVRDLRPAGRLLRAR
jgi:hypothetical protein